ncbi:MAG: flagellin [Mobilitalea sp.]
MRINHNISALKANNQLSKTNSMLDKSLERLSSGYRINSAADDSAGLAISEKMRTQISGLDQASRNASDGISVIQTAEGALVEVEAMLQRMRELAVQSANGTYTSEDRDAIQAEIDQLSGEITRISETTEFNTMTLLDGNIDRKSYSSNNNVKLVSLSDTVSVGDFKLTVEQDARQAVVLGDQATFSIPAITSNEVGSININGESVKIEEGDTLEDVFKKLRDVGDSVGVSVFAIASTANPSATTNLDLAGYTSDTWDGTNYLAFVSSEYGSNQKVEIYCDDPELAKLLGLSSTKTVATGVDAKATLDYSSKFENTATIAITGNKVTISDRDNFSMVVEIAAGTAATPFTDLKLDTTPPIANILPTIGTSTNAAVTISVLDAGPMDLQIGANEGQTMSVRIPKVDPATLGIDKVNIGTADGAQAAITLLDTAINQVSAIRSKLGAYQNRLEHSISNLDTTSENMTESLSRISDVDMAVEMANYTQKNVLAQAGTSMLAQANQRPQTILSLLQN